jgi:phage replication O-like protein O
MANPQKENGYTAIANDIMDALCRIRIPGEEMQVLHAIIRKTYGWNRKEDMVALSQLSEMTGLSKPHVCRALKGLLSKKAIVIAKNGNGRSNVVALEKDYEKWEPLPKKATLPKTVIGGAEKGNKGVPKKGPTKDIKDKKEKDTCPEPKKASVQGPADDPVFLTLPLKGSGSEFHITESVVGELSELYPAVDVRQQFREMRAWCMANPRNQKTPGGIMRFYTHWLSKEQDRAPRVQPPTQKKKSNYLP